jgi:hypothetical protein
MGSLVQKIFLSSTVRDLELHRLACIDLVNKLGNYINISMENYGVIDSPPVDLCLKRVQECDIYIGLFSHYRGFEVPKDKKKRSITELEYDEARKYRKPRLICVANDEFPVKAGLLGTADQQLRQRDFMERVLRDRVVYRDFSIPDKLASNVLIGLLNLNVDRASA